MGVLLALLGSLFVLAGPAFAASTGRILADPCLNFRAGYDHNTGWDNQIGCIPINVTVEIQCINYGLSVSGPYGTETVWDKVSYGGLTGYVSDAWVYTGTNGAAAGECAPPVVTPPPPADPQTCLLGVKWANPTNVTVDYGGNHRYLGNVIGAITEWNNANIGVHFTLLASPSSSANIHVVDINTPNDYYGKALLDPQYLNGFNVFSTPYPVEDPYTDTTPSAVLYPAHVTVNLNRYNIETNTATKFTGSAQRINALKTFTVAHEFGHTLGLGHSDSCGVTQQPSIMTAGDGHANTRTVITVQPFDVAEARFWYGLPSF
jgi:hypothetical protein